MAMATIYSDDACFLDDANWNLGLVRPTFELGFFEDRHDNFDMSHGLINSDHAYLLTSAEPEECVEAAGEATEEIYRAQSQLLLHESTAAQEHAEHAVPEECVPFEAALATRRARGGGNFSRVARDGMPRRELRVRKNRHGIAMFELTKGNEDKILNMIRWIQESKIQASVAELCHPCLHLSSFSVTAEEYDTLARVLFEHRGNAYIKAFRSFLCYLGMRPAHKQGREVFTFVFDAEGWNRQGYRLCKGGVPARGEGKPRILFIDP